MPMFRIRPRRPSGAALRMREIMSWVASQTLAGRLSDLTDWPGWTAAERAEQAALRLARSEEDLRQTLHEAVHLLERPIQYEFIMNPEVLREDP
jgi:hypothetical protein